MALTVATEEWAEILLRHAAAGALPHAPVALGMPRPDGMGLPALAAQQAWVAPVARGLPMANGTPSARTARTPRQSPRSITPASLQSVLRPGMAAGVGEEVGVGMAVGVGTAVGVGAADAGAADGAGDSASAGVPPGLPSGTGRPTGTTLGGTMAAQATTMLIPRLRGLRNLQTTSRMLSISRVLPK
jgi:hypothetical protein